MAFHFPRRRSLLLPIALTIVVLGAIIFAAAVYGQSGGCHQSLPTGSPVVGQLSSDCSSAVHSGKYARYYSFGLASPSEVTFTLESSDIDTYLYLLSGSETDGTVLHENDDLESGNTNSEISESLPAGTYTLEVTSYGEGETGAFTLSFVIAGQVSGPVGPGEPGAGLSPIRSGPAHVCVMNSSKDVECWSVISQGQLSGRTVYLQGDDNDPFIAFDTGDNHVCGLTVGEELICQIISGVPVTAPVPTAMPAPTPQPTAVPIADPTPDPSDTGDWVYRTGTLSSGTTFRSVELTAYRTGSGDGATELDVVCFNPTDSSPFLGVLVLYDLVVSTRQTVQVQLSWDQNAAVTETWAGYSTGTLISPRFHPTSLYDRQFVSRLLAHDDLSLQAHGTSRSFEADFRLHGFGNAYTPVQSYCGRQGTPAGEVSTDEMQRMMEEVSTILRALN